MAGGGKSAVVGYRYFMSLHMGLCRGPINRLKQIRVAELLAWAGDQTDSGSFEIAQPNLFGGDEKEGGVAGTFSLWMGNVGQVFSAQFKSLLGGLVPDFIGVCTATFDGTITSNNPYPKPWSFLVARWDQGWDRGAAWYPQKARIVVDGDIDAMNPAHIIYECLTNRDWGRGLDPSDIDEDYFIAAANTLCEELFGLCMVWTRQGDINEFIDSVLGHIGGVRFVNSENGKVAIRLIRGNYDPESLPTFTYNTGLLEITEDETGGGDSAYSEVIVNYTDARTGKEASQRAQSIALMQALGDIASTTAAYPGLPSAGLAARVARRDLEQQAAFLKRFTVILDRRAWRLNPGSLFRVTAADRGLNGVILRVGSIRDSEFKDGKITVVAVEDVFGLPSSGYEEPVVSGWTPPNTEATEVILSRLEEATYRDLVRALPPAELAALADTTGYLAVLAAQPAPLAIFYEIGTAATGETMQVRGRGDWTQVYPLAAGITHLTTVLSFGATADLSAVLPDSAAFIGDEIVRVDSVDNTLKTVTVARGCVDTIPAAHSLGTNVWFYEDEEGTDNRQYETSEAVDVRLLTVTNTDRLTLSEVLDQTITFNGRQSRPYPPGAVTVDAVPYTDHIYGYAAASGADVVFAWAHRDRVLQSDQMVEHSAASVGPEAGTTYTLRIYDGPTLLRTASGISGTSFTYTAAMITADGEPIAENWTVRLKAVRSGYDSWQEYEFPVNRRRSVNPSPGTGAITVDGFAPDLEVTSTSGVGTLTVDGYSPSV